jgi:hypothetical protein
VATLPATKHIARVEFGDSAPVRAVLKYSQGVPAARISVGVADWQVNEGKLSLPSTVTDDDLGALRDLKGVRSLTLDGADAVTDDGLAHLRSMELVQLDLRHLRNVTDAGLAHVTGMKTLESLNLWYCRNLSNKSIAGLARLPKLKKINLFGTQIDPKAFQAAVPNCEIAN